MGNCLHSNPQVRQPNPPSAPYVRRETPVQVPPRPTPAEVNHMEISILEEDDQEPASKKQPQAVSNYNHPQRYLNQAALYHRYQGTCNQNFANMVYVKIPTNREETAYQTVAQPLWIFPPLIAGIPLEQMRGGYFQEKLTWFRFQIERMRVDWQNGCEMMLVDRHNVLMSSFTQLQKMNLRKQIKIKFEGEEVDDAGGVLREWMNIAIKEIFNFQVAGLFRLCEGEQTSYRFIVDPEETEDEINLRTRVATLLGIIIGKAFFQRISLNCFLTKSIWRQICGKKVTFGDFYFYDNSMYSNLKILLENVCDTELGLYFNYLVTIDNKTETKLIQLKPKGSEIAVTDKNKGQFIKLLTEYFCIKQNEQYITAIKNGISKVFPIKLLQVFEPHEIEMVINGPQFIDVREWRASTIYKKCNPKDKQIQWFWKYVESLNQKQLGNLLHYVTGSRKLPILGFFYLESNRNQVNRFTIQKVPYDKGNPYPKGHTCFNRIQLPEYASEKDLKQRMDQLLANEINSFGLS